jgi:serine/threonine protein kinase
LHEMKVKHKDIKPANILIMNGHVLLADFGIWKDLIDQETTASLNSNGDIGTRMYGAPEVLSENHRRGRAADIYSLGCVFLELSTVLVGSQNSLEKWSRHRELSGTRLYSASASEILNRMRYLWASYVAQERTFADQWRPPVSQNDSMAWLGLATADRSFLTLDPNPRTQITARQMVAKLQRPDSRFLNLIQRKSCDTCRAFPDSFNPNLPLHSLYKYDMPENLLFDPDEVLHLEISSTWEEAKRSRLQTHMWW